MIIKKKEFRYHSREKGDTNCDGSEQENNRARPRAKHKSLVSVPHNSKCN